MGREYLAFISYRHKPLDQRFAALLSIGLETWHMPVNALALRRTFRDQEELPTSSDLGRDIENALASSGYLIPVCTPDYIKSKWCLRELELFIASGRKDRILPVLLSGSVEEAVPECIRDIPIAANLSNEIKDSDSRALSKAINGIAPQLLSAMSGISADRIISSRRRFRIAIGACIFTAATAALLAFGSYAMQTAEKIKNNNREITLATEQAVQARADEKSARDDALLKRAAYVAEEAWVAIEADDDRTAIELALEVLPEGPDSDRPLSTEALAALRAAVSMPQRQRNDYMLACSSPTDFEIKGWLPSEYSNALILEDGTYSPTKPVVYTNDGSITTVTGTISRAAAEAGYSRAYYANSGSPRCKIYYGAEKPMAVYSYYLDYEACTLNGEDFYADHVLENGSSYYFLAWMSEPGEGQSARAGLFSMKAAEAIAEIPAEGGIISASFSSRHSELATVDATGMLRTFTSDTGRLQGAAAGRYSYVDYCDSEDCLYAITADGAACCLDAVQLTVRYTLDSPVRVKQLMGCSLKNTILACCEDGFRIYDADDGRLLGSVQTADEPNYAIYGGYDSWLFMHDGESIIVLYDTLVEIYNLDTSLSYSDGCVSLFREGVSSYVGAVYYSADGETVYTAYTGGDIAAWDVQTGELLWFNLSDWTLQPSAHFSTSPGEDLSCFWRETNYLDGIEKIDAATGETVYTVLTEFHDHTAPVSVPGGRLMITCGRYSSDAAVFNCADGKLLWEREDLGDDMAFSDDGTRIYSLRQEADSALQTKKIYASVIDAFTGETLEETLLLTVDSTLFNAYTDYIFPDGVLCFKQYSVTDTDNASCYLIKLQTGEIKPFDIGSDECSYDSFSLMCSYDGTKLFYFELDDVQYCRVLNDDGSLGEEIYREDSAEYRRLCGAKNGLLSFDGEDCYLDRVFTRKGTWSNRLIRISDGATLLEGGSRSIAVAPDGSTACYYSSTATPVVARTIDAYTLIDIARARLGVN